MRSAPPATGTATKPLARSVERNSSKYSERDSGRSVTTDTRPCTPGSMMKVRPVTRAASWMKARMSASRRFSTYWAWSGASGAQTEAEARARAKNTRFTCSTSPASESPGRRDRPSQLISPPRIAARACSSELTRWPLIATITSPGTKPAARKAWPPSPPGETITPVTRPPLSRGWKLIGWPEGAGAAAAAIDRRRRLAGNARLPGPAPSRRPPSRRPATGRGRSAPSRRCG